MRYLLAPLLALCLITNASAQVSQEDLFESVCRVRSSDGKEAGIGTGFVFADNETTSYIMTCYHVVEENPTTVQFQREGFMSKEVPVEIVFKSYDPGKRDLAILAFDKSKLSGYSPRVLPLAGERDVNFGDHKMFTVGQLCSSVLSLHKMLDYTLVHLLRLVDRVAPLLELSQVPESILQSVSSDGTTQKHTRDEQ